MYLLDKRCVLIFFIFFQTTHAQHPLYDMRTFVQQLTVEAATPYALTRWFQHFIQKTNAALSRAKGPSLYDLKIAGLSEHYLDFIAFELCLKEPNLYMAMLFPNTLGQKVEEVRKHLNTTTQLVYEKIIWLKNYGFEGFIQQVPTKKIEWTHCYFPTSVRYVYPLRIFLVFSPRGVSEIKACKWRIRNIYKKPPSILKDYIRSMHTTDNQAETIQVAKVIFNQNSVKFINNMTTPLSGTQLTTLATLVSYKDKQLYLLNNQQTPYKEFLENCLYNPSAHFYYGGVKFACA